MQIIRPTFIVDKQKVLANLWRMQDKISASGGIIRFRPHFKTHQSLEVGHWLRQEGISAITVSSVDMAAQFARSGWSDITIAVLLNRLEIEQINYLASSLNLHLLIDSVEAALWLRQTLKHPVGIWIKIDTGYHRTGIDYEKKEEILLVVKALQQSKKLRFHGLLTHAGHSYHASSLFALKEIYHDTVTKLNVLREYLLQNGVLTVELSYGDTPTCSVMDKFYGIHEIRCGNFIYFDVQQLYLGTCYQEDIAAAVACPIIAKYPQRNEIVIYGGAVHLSKDVAIDANGQKIYGLVAPRHPQAFTWGPIINNTYVAALSQEHGIIKTTPHVLEQVHVGDILMILPVHACLAAHLLSHNTHLVT